MRELLADLPVVPSASASVQLVGPPALTLPALAVVARHVGQGLRDANLRIAHDRLRLRAERSKLAFLDADALAELIALGDRRALSETVLFVHDLATADLDGALSARDAAGLATFSTSTEPHPGLEHWRTLALPS